MGASNRSNAQLASLHETNSAIGLKNEGRGGPRASPLHLALGLRFWQDEWFETTLDTRGLFLRVGKDCNWLKADRRRPQLRQ